MVISELSHRSIIIKDAIILTEVTLFRELLSWKSCPSEALVTFDRILTELVAKMRDMKMDKSELACLRTIILLNPSIGPLINCDNFSNS